MFCFKMRKIVDKLEYAIGRDNLEMVKKILKSRTNTKYKSSFNKYLHIATSAEITRELLLHGANVNARDTEYLTPLHAAIIYQKEFPVVTELLAFGADVNAKGPDMCYEATTPMSLAVKIGNIEVIEELLNHSGLNISPEDMKLYSYYLPFKVAYANFIGKSKSIIERTLLNSIDKKEDDLDVKRFQKISSLETYIKDGRKELIKMKLYNFDEFKITDLNKLWKYNEKILETFLKDLKEIKSTFPVFGDAIIKRVETEIERRILLEDLNNLTLKDAGHRVVLNRCCLRDIAEYLNNKDLSNLTKANDTQV